MSYPGVHHLLCPEDLSPEQIVRYSVLLCLSQPNPEPTSFPTQNSFGPRPRGLPPKAQAAEYNLPEISRNRKQLGAYDPSEERPTTHDEESNIVKGAKRLVVCRMSSLSGAAL